MQPSRKSDLYVSSSDGTEQDQQSTSPTDANSTSVHELRLDRRDLTGVEGPASSRAQQDSIQPFAMQTSLSGEQWRYTHEQKNGQMTTDSQVSLARFTTASTTVVHLPEQYTGYIPDKTPTPKPHPFKKPVRFWLIFASLMSVTCLTAIDMTIISTTLPTIVQELPTTAISGSWVTSSFLLTETAFQPMMGGLADVWGRRNALLFSVLLFMAGSTMAALANTMLVLIVGRGIQGIGGGGVQAISEIVLSDLTTLRERGIFVGFLSLVFAVATFVAPLLGGFFSEHNWRWIFWINLPVGAAALCLIGPTMKLKRPTMPLKAKFERMDIPANAILLASVVAILVAVTDGGITHPWSSWRIYLPFTLGWVGMAVFFAIELTDNRFAPNPVLPRRLFASRTAGACFAITFLHGVITYGLIYIIPLYFQAVRGSSPMRSAVQLFPATAPSPFAAIAAGIVMVITGKYRMQMWFWWSLITVGCGLTVLLNIDTPTWEWVIIQVIPGLGVGALFTLSLPPIQASLPVDELAHATASFAFCRSFGSVWGIALGTNVFVSVVNGRLDQTPQFRELGLTGATALGAVERLGALPSELVLPARLAFAYALRIAFICFIPISAVGLLISFLVKDLPLPDMNESKHGLRDKESKATGTRPSVRSDSAAGESHAMPPLFPHASYSNFSSTSQDTLIRMRAAEPQSRFAFPQPPVPSLRVSSRNL